MKAIALLAAALSLYALAGCDDVKVEKSSSSSATPQVQSKPATSQNDALKSNPNIPDAAKKAMGVH